MKTIILILSLLPINSIYCYAQNDLIDIKLIFKKSNTEIIQLFGKPNEINNVKGYPCTKGNCVRYFFKNKQIDILFSNGRVIQVGIFGISNYSNNVNALKVLGLNSSRKPTKHIKDKEISWKNILGFNSVEFYTNYLIVQSID